VLCSLRLCSSVFFVFVFGIRYASFLWMCHETLSEKDRGWLKECLDGARISGGKEKTKEKRKDFGWLAFAGLSLCC